MNGAAIETLPQSYVAAFRRATSAGSKARMFVLRSGVQWVISCNSLYSGRLSASRSSGDVSVLGHWHTGAHQVAIAIDIVDAPDGGPIFIRPGYSPWKAALRARIGPRPTIFRDVLGRMWCQPKRGSRDRDVARLDLGDFLPNRDHCVAEPIELLLRFGFRRLDHQGPRNRKAHSGRVEAVVDEAFGYVVDCYAAGFLQPPRINDAFMRDAAGIIAVKNRKMRVESRCDIVRAKDRDLGCSAQPVRAHHQNIGQRDRQDRG